MLRYNCLLNDYFKLVVEMQLLVAMATLLKV